MPALAEDLNQAGRLRWEQGLIARARTGDREAFAEIYRAYAQAVFAKVLLPKLGNRDAAEDALAETFRTAFERLGGFESRDVSLYFWLSRIATNKALDMHRARATTGRALASFETLVAPLGEAPPDPAILLDLRADSERMKAGVKDVLERLNPRYRSAIELRFVEDLDREECAAALGVKLGTFDVLLLRALRSFRKEWTTRFGEEAAHDDG
jgi:RNA polymerase sigma-70 factor, ECF subfamily